MAVLLANSLALPAARACNVPVFRYALERWRPDAFEAIVFHRGPLSAEQQQLLAELRQVGDGSRAVANLEVVTVDLADQRDGPRQKIWQAQGNPELPWLVVRYPAAQDIQQPAWAGPFDAAAVRALLHSPVRQEVARRLLQGQSAIWLLLESGDKNKDNTAAQLLQAKLDDLEKTLKLPTDELSDEAKDRPPAADPAAAPMLSPLPLKIKFSVLRLARTDSAEKLFVAMLLNAHTSERLGKAKTEPVLFPVFGRGRVLDSFIGDEIKADTIGEVAAFLCGACSCTVKALNPGVDMLFTEDWDRILQGGTIAKEEPPLTPGERVPIPSGKATPAPPVTEAAASVLVENHPRDSQRYLWLGLGAAGVLVLLTGTLALRSRKPPTP